MATATYTPLQTITLSSSASSVVFASIPSTYRDLVLIANYTVASTYNSGKMYLNTDTSTSSLYVGSRMKAYNNETQQSNNNGGAIRWEVQTTNLVMAQIEIMDYSATDKHKIILMRVDSGGTQTYGGTEISSSKWGRTDVVDTITLAFGTDFQSGSTFSLFGIEA